LRRAFVLAAGNTVVFNLADVFFMVGNVLVTATLMAAAIQNRHRLGGWDRTLLVRLRT
jgi:lipoprotein signal peptidase